MISLELVKKHLNVDESFKDDDIYILHLISVSEKAVLNDLDLNNDFDMLDDEGQIKPDIQHAILLLIGTLYANREAISFGNPNKIPFAYQYLLDLNHDYSYKE